MRTCICIGNYAATPYYIAGLELPVYCVEELCYCMKEHAFFLDKSLMNEALADWIGSVCALPELAGSLSLLIRRQDSLSSFVRMILEYVGLYDSAEIREVEEVLQKGSGLSGIEKRKSQIDALVEQKKYVTAIRGYDALLEKWEEDSPELPAGEVRASIFHNKGVVMARLMRYGQAAECFLKAAEISRKMCEYEAFLAAKRMELSESEYIAFAAGLSGNYDSTLALERTMEQLRQGWEEQVSYKRLALRKSWREGGDRQKYYEENERLTQALKEEYRDSVSE